MPRCWEVSCRRSRKPWEGEGGKKIHFPFSFTCSCKQIPLPPPSRKKKGEIYIHTHTHTHTLTLVTCIYYFLMQYQQNDLYRGTQKKPCFFISNQLLLYSFIDLEPHTRFLTSPMLNTCSFPLFMWKQEYRTPFVSLIITVHQGRELYHETPARYAGFFPVFSTSNSSQHRMAIQICFKVSIFTPPQITTQNQILAEYKNFPAKTKESVQKH